MNWILLAPMLALVVAIYVVAAAIGSRRGYRHGMKAFEAEYRKLQVDHGVVVAKADRLEYERDDARIQSDRLNTENVQIVEDSNKIAKKWFELNAQNAELREALQEKIVEIKALHMQTVETEEVNPEPVKLESPPEVPFLTPALQELEKPKRPPRKKATQN